MSTSMTASKYVNFFITDVLHIKARHASNIRLYCGIFDAINDPIMGVIVDKTRSRWGKMRGYIKFAPYFVSLFMILFFVGNNDLSYGFKMALTVFAFVGLDVTYTAFDVPMGALAFSMTPNGTERTKLYGIASIGRMIIGALPAALVAFAAWLPYFNSNLDKAYLVAAVLSAVFIIVLTRFTFANCQERMEHSEDTPSLNECIHLLLTNRPLLMLFLCNIFLLLSRFPSSVRFILRMTHFSMQSITDFSMLLKLPVLLWQVCLFLSLLSDWAQRATAKILSGLLCYGYNSQRSFCTFNI